jgi:hypothetical protein
MLVGSRHVSLMTLGSLRFGLSLCDIPRKISFFYYSDWRYIQAQAGVITEVIVTELKARWRPLVASRRA